MEKSSDNKKYKARFHKSDVLDEFFKETSIENKLKVLFEMEYLTIIIKPDRQANGDEIKEARDWAEKMVKWVLDDYKAWEENGRPE